jgi:hypothetical protein
MSNKARVMRAGDILGVYQQATGADIEDALADLLADLMHWAAVGDWRDSEHLRTTFDHELGRARGHFEFEVLDGGEGR